MESEKRNGNSDFIKHRYPIPSCNGQSRTGNPISALDISFFDGIDCCDLIDNRIAVRFPINNSSFPTIRQQKLDTFNLEYIGYHNTRLNDNRSPENKTVGYFTTDRHFRALIHEPWAYIDRLRQYKQTMTPDNSCYTDMYVDDQKLAILQNRIAGALWQAHGINVIPTVTWGDSSTYGFAFLGIEEHAKVAVSTLGTNDDKELFMNGFKELCSEINPSLVLCYCLPYPEMQDYAEIQFIEHEARTASRLVRKKRNDPGQTLFDYL